jgi:hypothetical protein
MADLSRAIGTFYNIVKEIKKFVDYDKLWVDYPAFLLPPDTTLEDPPSSGFELPPPWTWPLATEAVAPAAGAALDAATATLAVVVVVAAAQAALAVLAPGDRGRFWHGKLRRHLRLAYSQRQRLLRPPGEHARPRSNPLPRGSRPILR